jgi:DNA-directed RNA polymerase beta subunit
MVNRLIQGSLGRAGEDDRDYYGKKRMDMAGALLSNLFRQQFRIVVEDMKKTVEKELSLKNPTKGFYFLFLVSKVGIGDYIVGNRGRFDMRKRFYFWGGVGFFD